ncbi:hypothetical protein E4U44_002011 [Claviceps purpurea]|nr:hypothetical protein E4U44_002011 [Claviceps purpurea]
MDRTSLVKGKQVIRTKLRNVMETHDVFFNAYMHSVPEMLAELVEQEQCPSKASYAGPAPRSSPHHTSASAPATTDNEDELPVDCSEGPSTDRQEK